MQKTEFSCVDCWKYGCNLGDMSNCPEFCLTQKISLEKLDKLREQYSDECNIDSTLTKTSTTIDSEFYCKYTRVEETISFAKKINVKKLGIAYCAGLAEEAKIFAKIAEENGLAVYGVICKVGSIDKCDIGFADSLKHRPGTHESLCNPILQAEILEEVGTDLNVVIGLCVGHDSIFYRHSKAPVTTLIAKDRVLGHNPVAALYTANGFYKEKMKNIK